MLKQRIFQLTACQGVVTVASKVRIKPKEKSDMSTQYKGINYAGPGSNTNRNSKTGIRYGIIPANDVCQAWYDSSEADYGKPHCPYCGNELKEGKDYKRCPQCRKPIREMGECYPDEAQGFYIESAELKAFSDDSGDIWVVESEYFTYAQFCSPCAPGACYLRNALESPEEDNKCYCLGHDWFEENKAPYPVYSVKTGEQINPQ